MSMSMEDERRVIRAVLAGDADRFEELVRACEGGVWRLCRRMLGNDEDAMDASQEAFFRAYRGLDSFRGDSRFATWLYRLASNICLDMLRKRAAAPVTEDDGRLDALSDPAPSPQEALERKDLRAAVDRAIMTLPPEFREALVLRDVNGLRYDEIAAVTGLEPGTVKSRICRARKKLAAALMDDGNFSELYPSKPARENHGKGGAKA